MNQEKKTKIDLSIIYPYSNWHFERCDPRFGMKHPGRIPGQIYINLFYFFTNKNDIVLDVFCGGGTSLDVGKIMNRKVIGLDIAPRRKDIIKFDVLLEKNPFPNEYFQLLFLDPPYYNINKGRYTNLKTDLSNLDLKNFLQAIEIIIKKFYRSLKKDGYFGLIISNKREGSKYYDLGFLCQEILSKYMRIHHRLSVPYENTSYHTNKWRNIGINKKIILIGTRDLMIFKKIDE